MALPKNKKPLKDETIVARLNKANKEENFQDFQDLVERMGVFYKFQPYGTFLHYACAHKNIEQIDYLLNLGAKISLKNKNNQRPLDLVLQAHTLTFDIIDTLEYSSKWIPKIDEIVERLIKKGAPYLESNVLNQALYVGLPKLTERLLNELDIEKQKIFLNGKTAFEISVNSLLNNHTNATPSFFVLTQSLSGFTASTEERTDLKELDHLFQTLDVVVRHPTFHQSELLTDEWVNKLSQIDNDYNSLLNLEIFISQNQFGYKKVKPEDSPISLALKQKFLQYRMERQLPQSNFKNKVKNRI